MKKIILTSLLLLSSCAPKEHPALSIPETAIIGGRSVSVEEVAATATVQVFKISADARTISACTGNLVASHVVLTAAHCAAEKGESNWVYFGLKVPKDFFSFLRQPGVESARLRSVVKASVPRDWLDHGSKAAQNWHDLGLLRFAGEAPVGYTPLTLRPWPVRDGEPVRIAGFGLIDGKNEIAAQDLQQTDVSVLNENWSATEMLLDTSRGHASCHGDSGGPAFVMTPEGEEILVGIDSRSELKSDPEFECSGNTIYTRIEPALSWILGEISSLN